MLDLLFVSFLDFLVGRQMSVHVPNASSIQSFVPINASGAGDPSMQAGEPGLARGSVNSSERSAKG